MNNGVEKDAPVWIVQDAAAQEPRAVVAAAAYEDSLRRAGLEQTCGRGRGRGRGGPIVPPKPFASFPVPGAVPVVFHPTPGGQGVAPLAFGAAKRGTDSLVDDVAMSGSDDAIADQSSHRLLYATPVFSDTVHLSGRRASRCASPRAPRRRSSASGS